MSSAIHTTHDSTWAWLRPFLLSAAAGFGIVALWWFFVGTRSGQVMDAAALEGGRIGSRYVNRLNYWLLNKVSVPAIALAMVVVAATALLRRRWLLALEAAVVIAGANFSTQVLKYSIFTRSDLMGSTTSMANVNSLPSGHTTAAASACVAAVLVAPPALRVLAACLGALGMVAFGWSTVASSWHRPSDVVAALLVCFCWALMALAIEALRFRLLGRTSAERTVSATPSRFWPGLMLTGGLVALALAFWGIWWARDLGEFTRDTTFTAYAASSLGIVGVASAGMAVLLRLVQRLDARRG